MYNRQILADYLKTNNVSKKEFASKINLSTSYVTKSINGNIDPSWSAIKAIAQQTKIPVTEFFTDDTYKELEAKAAFSIEIIKNYEPAEGYFLAFSGGKDSVVLYELACRAGVKFDAHYSNTQIDPPELRIFIKRNYPNIDWINPKHSMFKLVEKHHILPMRTIRYCCRELKESSSGDHVLLAGVRASESYARSKYSVYSKLKDKEVVYPILYWSEIDVWLFTILNDLPYCKLYDEGFKRLGCIGCPMATTKQRRFEFDRYPSIEKAYKRALTKVFNEHPNKYFGTDVDAYFNWWITGDSTDEYFAKHGKPPYTRI